MSEKKMDKYTKRMNTIFWLCEHASACKVSDMGRGIYYNDFLGLGKSFIAVWNEDGDDDTSKEDVIAGLQIALAEIMMNTGDNNGRDLPNMSTFNPGCTALASTNLLVAGYHQDEYGSMTIMVAPRDDPASVTSTGLTPLDLINNISLPDATYSQYDALTDFCLLESDLQTRTKQLVQDVSDYLLVQLIRNGITCCERNTAWTMRPIRSINDKLPPDNPEALAALHDTLREKIAINMAYLNRSDCEKILSLTQEGRDYLLHEIDNHADENPFGRALVMATVGNLAASEAGYGSKYVKVRFADVTRARYYTPLMLKRDLVEAVGTVEGVFNGELVTTLKLSAASLSPDVNQLLKDAYAMNFNGRAAFLTDIAEMEAAGLDCALRHADTDAMKV
jgi:hypothetical protein